MSEELLTSKNKEYKIPLLILRPSILAAALEEPVPGWTDSITNLGGIVLTVGIGILKDFVVNPNLIADIVPVDFVVN